MVRRAHSPTPSGGDEFFRQLIGEERVDAPDPSSRSQEPASDPPTGGTLDPHVTHPIAPAEPAQKRRRGGRTARPAAAPRHRPVADGGLRRRAIAATALSLGVLATAAVVLGADRREPARAKAADPRGVPNGTPPAGEEARLRAWWSQDGQKSLRERWRRDAEATIEGRLTTGGGEPVTAATVTILAADATRRDAVNRTVGEVRTDREGRFEAAIALDRGAPRKRLTFSYLAYANDTVPAATTRASLVVTPPITLDADQRSMSRGEELTLDGRTTPGARITLAAQAPASDQWQQLDDVQADRHGNWQATVRAPEDASPGTWRFRAQVAQSRDNGYVGANSDPVSVEVD